MIHRKTVILIIVAAAVLISGILLLTLLPESGTETDTDVQTETQPDIAGTGNLIRASHLDVDSVIMMPADGRSYTLKVDRTETEYLKFEIIAEDAVFPGMQPVMYTIFTQATTLFNLTKITENANNEQLSLYGFDTPVLTWRVNFTDGSSDEFALGLRLATGNGHYIRSTADNDVYILDNSAVQILFTDVDYIYDIYFFPFPEGWNDFEVWEFIDHLILERPGEETIEIRRRSFDEWADLPIGASRYDIIQPFSGEGNEQVIRNILMEPIINVIPERIIETGVRDPAIYGLDDPVRLIASMEDWEGTLLIGNQSAEFRGRYIMIEGYDAVLLDPHGNYGFLEMNPSQIRSQMTWIHYIDEVSSIVFELDGVRRTLDIGHPTANGEEPLNGLLDGVEIGESNTRRLYAAAMSIPSSGGSDAAIPGGEPVYRMTMNFVRGGSQSLAFYSLNDSEFLMVLDGESLENFTTRLQIQLHLLNQFDLLDAGEDLPMR